MKCFSSNNTFWSLKASTRLPWLHLMMSLSGMPATCFVVTSSMWLNYWRYCMLTVTVHQSLFCSILGCSQGAILWRTCLFSLKRSLVAMVAQLLTVTLLMSDCRARWYHDVIFWQRSDWYSNFLKSTRNLNWLSSNKPEFFRVLSFNTLTVILCSAKFTSSRPPRQRSCFCYWSNSHCSF